MDKNDQSHFKLSSGSMLNIFLESDIIEQIQKIQKKQNLKDEREVIIHLIQNHYDKIILGTPKHSNIIDNEFPKNIFDGKLDLVKLDKILDIIKSENLIKKLPQHEIYNKSSAGLIHRLHTKILPVKFSLMCLSKMIIEITNKQIMGIIHLAGNTRISRYEFAKMISEKFNLDSSFLKPRKLDDMKWNALRPTDSSLNVTKAKEILKNKPQNIDYSLDLFFEQIK